MDVKRKTVAQIKNVKEFVNKPVSETTADPYLPRSVLGVQKPQMVSTHPEVLSLGKYLLLSSGSLFKKRINFTF